MAQTQDGWQLEASAPELYERFLVPAIALRTSSSAPLRNQANAFWT